MRARIASALVSALLLSVLSATVAQAAQPGSTVSVGNLLAEFSPVSAITSGYDRALFEHWVDADGDGCDTRQEVLIVESVAPVTVGAGCALSGGQWNSWYDGASWTNSSDVDIDHFVPLSEAWQSGANAWTADTRRAFANDLDYDLSLVAVTDDVNQSKGDRDPAQWMPPLVDSLTQCRYATEWMLVKYRWSLSMDAAELNALSNYLAGACGTTTVTVPTKAVAPVDQPPLPEPMTTQLTVYRFWSPQNQTHFYTMSVAERDLIISSYPTNIWTYEGPRFQAYPNPEAGTVPLYRFWSPRLSGHFFTTNEAERNQVSNDYDDYTWTYEGIAFFVYPTAAEIPGGSMVARFWSPQNQHHFYTASAQEAEVVRGYPQRVWTFEGNNYQVPAEANLPIPATPPQYVTPPPPIVTPPPPSPPANPGDTKNCGDFRSQGEAQAWFSFYYPYYQDIARLDGNNDMRACESYRY